MLAAVERTARRLRRNQGGNATLLVALGMPALIGGAGLAVDTAQWYMWKRELQYAVDQAAIAGAWSRAKDPSGTMYQARARMEFSSNKSIVDFATTPTVALADYLGGDDNSVVVTTSATRMLPFSGFLTGRAATIGAMAQASFEAGDTYTSCLIAVDDDASGAITIGGNATLTGGCGMAALSRSDTAVVINGNPQIDAGWVLAAGGIDSWLATHTDDEIHEHLTGLYDPFAQLSPPNDPTPRTYSCTPGRTTTRANVATTDDTTYSYWRGPDYNTASPTSYNRSRNREFTSRNESYVIVSNSTVNGTVVTTTVTWTAVNGSSVNTVWEKKTTVTSNTYSNVTSTTLPPGAHMLPGTYSSFVTACDTTMASGVYVIDGGMFTVRAQDVVTGNGVMIVLKNGGGIVINGGATVNLTAMTSSQLLGLGLSAANANRLAGMLVFEDRNSQGNDGNRINGNASTVLNGTIYLPRSNVRFAGTAGVTSQCLTIAASTITIEGTANMSTFCPPGRVSDTIVATTSNAVRLVS